MTLRALLSALRALRDVERDPIDVLFVSAGLALVAWLAPCALVSLLILDFTISCAVRWTSTDGEETP